MMTYTLSGGAPTETYTPRLTVRDDEQPIYQYEPRTLSSFKRLWVDQDMSTVQAMAMVDSSHCASQVAVTGGITITLPDNLPGDA